MNRLFAAIALLTGICGSYAADLLAFPGAEGMGRYATGGRGGRVIRVTNTNDSGAGSYRAALAATGARIVVFATGGRIHLTTKATITDGNLTILGHTAPGPDGVYISGRQTTLSRSNLIVRHMRFRLGDAWGLTAGNDDALDIIGINVDNVIVDHVTTSWGIDETFSTYLVKRMTIQNSIVSEGLYDSYDDEGGDRSYGSLAGSYTNAPAGETGQSWFYNLFANNRYRNPVMFHRNPDDPIPPDQYGTTTDFRRNVVWNADSTTAIQAYRGFHNIVENYFKSGPATGSTASEFFITTSSVASEKVEGLFVTNNVLTSNPLVLPDNRVGCRYVTAFYDEPISWYSPPSGTMTAEEAYAYVLTNVGAIYPRRDSVDTRLISEVISGVPAYGGLFGEGRGIIDSQETVGGYPVFATGPAYVDTDEDGLPDDWETAEGLDPNDSTDSDDIDPVTGYAWIELWGEDLLDGSYPYESSPVEVPTGTKVTISGKANIGGTWQ